MQTVYNESSFEYPPIGVFIAVGFIWTSRRGNSGDFSTEEVGGFVDLIVSVSENSITGLFVGSLITSLESQWSIFLFV